MSRENAFRLESLEPRILLSADPVLAELARWALDDGPSESERAVAAIFQEIDAAAESDSAAGDSTEPDGLDETGPVVLWPAEWDGIESQFGDGPNLTVGAKSLSRIWFVDGIGDSEDGASTDGGINLFAMILSLVGQALDASYSAGGGTNATESTGQGRPAAESDDPTASGGSPGFHARAPPVDDGGPAAEQIHAIFAAALNVWSETVLDDELIAKLGDLNVAIVDLPGDAVAALGADTIYIDATAAGHGWFVDPALLAGEGPGNGPTAFGAAGGDEGPGGTENPQPFVSSGSDDDGTITVGASTSGAADDGLPPTLGGSDQVRISAPPLGSMPSVEAAPYHFGAAQAGADTSDIPVNGTQPEGPADQVSGSVDRDAYSSGDDPIGSPDGQQQLLALLLDLVSSALGLTGAEAADAGEQDLVVGFVATGHRVEQSQRSTLGQSIRRDGGKAGGESGASQISPTTESDVGGAPDIGDDAIPRGPPGFVATSTHYLEERTPAAIWDGRIVSFSTDDDVPVWPPLGETPARAPPSGVVMPRAPPADSGNSGNYSDSARYLLTDGIAVDTVIEKPLTPEQLDAILQQALRLWSQSSLAAGLADRLDEISAQIAELPGGVIGEAIGHRIYVDSSAAGHGWFVDATPSDDTEFELVLATGRLAANLQSPAYDQIDLLTVLVHEIGHVLGFEHGDQLEVMDAKLGVGQRVTLDGGSPSASLPASPMAATLITGTAPDRTLDLSGATAVDAGIGITITVNSDGTISVTDSVADNETNEADITTIIGSGGKDTLVGPNLEAVWDLNSKNAGTLTVGAGIFGFSEIENLTGGSAKDTFIIDDAGFVTGDIEEGGGTLALQLFDYFFVSGTFSFENKTDNLKRSDDIDFSAVDYQLVGASGVDAFVGVNGPYVDDATTPDAVGLSLTGIDFSLLRFTDTANDVSYTALKATGTDASLVGLTGDLVLDAYAFTVALNRTSDTGNPNTVLDFNDGAGDSVIGIPVTPTAAGPTIDFEGEDGALLAITGNAVIDAFGILVAKATGSGDGPGFSLDLGQASTTAANGTGSVEFTDASVVKVSLSNAALFVGIGGSLSGSGAGASVVDGSLGFGATVDSLKLVSIKDGTTSYLGVEISNLAASLIGFSGVLDFQAFETNVQVNRATAGAKLDWDSLATSGIALVGFLDIDEALDVHADGKVAFDALGLVVGKATGTGGPGFSLDLGQASTTAANGTGSVEFTDASVVKVSLSNAALFVGIGGSLSGSGAGASVVDGSLGFGATVDSLKLVSIKDGTTSYLGVEISNLAASLIGFSGVLDFQAFETNVQVNRATAGAKLDWDSLATSGIALVGFLDIDEALDVHADGKVAFDALGLVVGKATGTGGPGFSLDLGQASTTAANGTGSVEFTDASVVKVSLSNAALFVGIGGSLSGAGAGASVVDGSLGFGATVDSLKLVSIKDGTTSYLGVEISNLAASLIGLEDVLAFGTWGVTIQVNQATAGSKLDWDSLATSGIGLAGFLDIDEAVDVHADGNVALNALGGLLVGAATGNTTGDVGPGFELTLGTVSGTDGTTVLVDASAVSVSLRGIDLWVGIGGDLADNPGGAATPEIFSDDQVVSGSLGVRGSLSALKLGIVKVVSTTADAPAAGQTTVLTTSYLGVELSGLTVSLIGLEAVLEFHAWDVDVLVNKASAVQQVNTTATGLIDQAASDTLNAAGLPAAPAKLDWNALITDGATPFTGTLPSFSPALDPSVDLAISGNVALNILDGIAVVTATGDGTTGAPGFSLKLGTVSGDSADDGVAAIVDGQAMALELTGIDLWVGIGGDLADNPGGAATPEIFSDDQVVSGSLGFRAALDSLKLATIKVIDATDLTSTSYRSYMALEVSGLAAHLVGLPDDLLTFTAWGVGLQLNTASDVVAGVASVTPPAKLDWADFAATSTGVALPAFSAGLDETVELFAEGNVALNVLGFVVGKASFQMISRSIDVDTNDNGFSTGDPEDIDDGSLLFVSLSNVDLFIGVGGSLKDELGDNDVDVPANVADDTVDVTDALGFEVANGGLDLAMIKPSAAAILAGDTRSYLGLELTIGRAELIGIPDLTFRATEVLVQVNGASGMRTLASPIAGRLDWTSALSTNTGVLPSFAMSQSVELRAAGTVALDVAGFVIGQGSFELVKGKVDIDVNGNGTEILIDGSILLVSLSGLDLFIGVGGALDDNDTPDDFGDDAINTDGAIGFEVANAGLDLAMLKPGLTAVQAGDTRSYLGLQLTVGQAGLVGLEDVPLEFTAADVLVQINQASGDNGAAAPIVAQRLDWDQALAGNDPDLLPIFAIDPALLLTSVVELRASGTVAMNLVGFVLVNGGFAIEKRRINVDVDANNTFNPQAVNSPDLQDASLMTVTLSDVNLFVGVGGAFDDKGTDSILDDEIDKTNAIGFSVTGANLALAILKPSVVGVQAGDTRSYLALKATIASAGLVGLDDLPISASITDLSVEINKASGAKGTLMAQPLDWSKALNLNPNDDAQFHDIIDPGPSLPVPVNDGSLALDFSGSLLRASGQLNLAISEFVFVQGNFAFEKSANIFITEQGATTTTEVTVLKVGASNVNIFAGIGGPPVFEDNNSPANDNMPDGVIDKYDTPNEDGLMGVAIGVDEFGLALMKQAVPVGGTPPAVIKSYTALRAVGSVKLLGIEGLTIAAEQLTVEVNIANGPVGTKPVDFTRLAGGGLEVPTGTGTPVVLLDYAAELIQASGFVTLTIDQFVHVSGSFAFKKGGAPQTVTLSDTTTVNNVSIMTIGASMGSDVNAFVGIGGPYFQDSNGDGVIDETDEVLADEAMGIALSDLEFGLALMKELPPVGGPVPASLRSFYALRASGSVELVGIEGLTVAARDMTVEVNGGALPPPGTGPPVAVNFDTSFGTTGLVVPTGPESELTLGGTADAPDNIFNGPIIRASGFVTISISEFVHISGKFAFEKGPTVSNVKLSDGNTIASASVLKIGADDINIFVGTGGPYFQDDSGPLGVPDGIIDGNDTILSDGAVGLAVSDAGFGLALIKELAPANTTPTTPLRSFHALKANGNVALVGVDDVTLSAVGINVAVNGGPTATTTGTAPPPPPVVIDFKLTDFDGVAAGVQSNLEVPTGGDPVVLDFEDPLLRASGRVALGIAGVQVAADIFFEQTVRANGSKVIKVAMVDMGLVLGDPDPVITIGDVDPLGNDAIDGPEGFILITDLGLAAEISLPLEFAVGEAMDGATIVDAGATSKVALNGAVAVGDTWTIELDGNPVGAGFVATDTKLATVAANLADLADGEIGFVAAVEGSSLVVTKLDGSVFTVAVKQNGVAAATVTVAAESKTITLDALVVVGDRWSITVNDVPVGFGFIATDTAEATVAAELTALVDGKTDFTAAFEGAMLVVTWLNPGSDSLTVTVDTQEPIVSFQSTVQLAINNTNQLVNEEFFLSDAAIANPASVADASNTQKVVLTGSTAIGNSWTMALNGTELEVTFTATDTALATVATGLAARVNGNADFVAATEGATLVVTKLNGDPLTVEVEKNNVDSATITDATASKIITLTEPVEIGDRWSITLDDGAARVEARATSVTAATLATELASLLSAQTGFAAVAKTDRVIVTKIAGGDLAVTVDAARPEILNLPAGPYFRIAAIDLAVQVNVDGEQFDLSGDFQFEQFTLQGTANPVQKIIRISAADVEATVASVEFDNGIGAFIIGPTGIAGVLGVSIKTEGSELFGVEGDVVLRINNTGQLVNEVISLDGQNIRIEFLTEDQRNIVEFAILNASLSFDPFFSLSGDFTVESQTNKTLYGARNVELFMGEGPYRDDAGEINPEAIGILVTNGTLGVIKMGTATPATTDDTIAVFAFGRAALVGLDGLTVGGTISVRINSTGLAIDESITLPSLPNAPNPATDGEDNDGDGQIDEVGETIPNTIRVKFGSTAKIEIFEAGFDELGNIQDDTLFTISAADVFSIAGAIRFTRAPTGRVDVDVPEATVAISIPNEETGGTQEAFSISGAARFAIGGDLGFQLQDLRVSGYAVFGVGAEIQTPASALQPLTADLLSPVNGSTIDVAKLNQQGYIDVVYNDVNRAGLTDSTITDDTAEFLLVGNAATNVTVNGAATKVTDAPNDRTFRYTFSGQFTENLASFTPTQKLVEITFVNESWTDLDGGRGIAETERFSLAPTPAVGADLPPPPPTARLVSPFGGAPISKTSINAKRYIDVTFTSPTGEAIEGIDGDEIQLSGAGAANIGVVNLTQTGTGQNQGRPMGSGFLSGTPQRLTQNTYRYFVSPKVATPAIQFAETFVNGDVVVTMVHDGIYVGR